MHKLARLPRKGHNELFYSLLMKKYVYEYFPKLIFLNCDNPNSRVNAYNRKITKIVFNEMNELFNKLRIDLLLNNLDTTLYFNLFMEDFKLLKFWIDRLKQTFN